MVCSAAPFAAQFQEIYQREQTHERIVLEVRRFGRAKPCKLEFLRTDAPRGAGAG